MNLDHLDMAIAFTVVMLTVSLLVTIFVQTVSAVSGLRGTNLRWGVEELLRTLHPELGDRAGALADRILQHPIISDSAMARSAWLRKLPLVGRWINRLHYASAIRVQELVGMLDLLAGPTPPPATLSPDADEQAQIAYIAAEARRDLSAGTNELSRWFNTAMDRVSQRFTTHMRVWTVAASIVVAFALHLDTFRLLSQLAASPDARARLAAASDAITRVAAGPPLSPGADAAVAPQTAAPPVLYQDVMKPLVAAGGPLQAVGSAPLPGFFPDCVAAADWLRAAMAGAGRPTAEIETAVATYEHAVDEALTRNVSAREADVRRLSDQALTARGILGTAGFQLVPDPYHTWDFSPWWPTPVWAGFRFRTVWNFARDLFLVRPSNLHFWGILFSAGLLSLGAPFWYNALKSLSALKPIVAKKEDQERTV